MEYLHKAYKANLEDINQIEIDVSNSKLTFIPIKENSLVIDYYMCDKYEPEKITNKNSVIYFERKNKKFNHVINIFNFSRDVIHNDEIKIYLPYNFKGRIFASTSNAKITFNEFEAKDISLSTSNAKLELNNSSFDKCYINTSNASIDINDVKGKIIEANTSNGKICISDAKVDGLICLKTSNASIHMDDVESNNYAINTSNGAIKGTIIGNPSSYMIRASTTNGSNNLGSNKIESEDRKIYMETSNAPINIKFGDK